MDGVSIDVEPGSLVGLVGPNGSGKTTLLDAVSGLVRCNQGNVHLDDENIVDYLPEERAHLGIVRSFQDCRLYPELTVEDTLLVCEDARRPSDVVSTTLRLPWATKAEKEKRAAVERRHRFVRPRALPQPPDEPALHRDAKGRGPRVDRSFQTPAPVARRAHSRHRSTRGRGLHPASARGSKKSQERRSCS